MRPMTLRERVDSITHDLTTDDALFSGVLDRMIEKARQALHDGETKTQPLAQFARRIVDLMEFRENRLQFLFRDAELRGNAARLIHRVKRGLVPVHLIGELVQSESGVGGRRLVRIIFA